MKTASALTKSHPREPARQSAYERDFYAWLLTQVSALRERRFSDLDLENLIEEVEDLARSIPREIRNRLKVVLVHLLKWQFQPSKRSTSWEVTLLEQRDQLEQLLEQNPSLRRQVPDLIQRAYATAGKIAGKEMKFEKYRWQQLLPPQCPWTPEQILDNDFLPNPSRSASR